MSAAMTRPGIDVERLVQRFCRREGLSRDDAEYDARLAHLAERAVRFTLRAAARIADSLTVPEGEEPPDPEDIDAYAMGRADAAIAIRHAARTRKEK